MRWPPTAIIPQTECISQQSERKPVVPAIFDIPTTSLLSRNRKTMTAFVHPLIGTQSPPRQGSSFCRGRPSLASGPHAAAHVAKRATIQAAVSPTSPPQTQRLVDDLLRKIENTDSGMDVSQTERGEIDTIIEQLTQIGKYQTPMTDPRLFSNYTVAYTSTNDKSPPAGGLFRSRIGRVLFKTRGLYQHVMTPATVINMVCFRLLGVLKGCASLRGKLVPLVNDKMGPNAIKVNFEKPRLRLGGAVFQFGPRSQVQLATTYLDDRVRLAIGSRGSLFVFAKGGTATSEMANEWKYIWNAQPLPAIIIPVSVLGAVGLASFGSWPLRVGSVVLAGMLGYVLKRGGIADNAPGAIED